MLVPWVSLLCWLIHTEEWANEVQVGEIVFINRQHHAYLQHVFMRRETPGHTQASSLPMQVAFSLCDGDHSLGYYLLGLVLKVQDPNAAKPTLFSSRYRRQSPNNATSDWWLCCQCHAVNHGIRLLPSRAPRHGQLLQHWPHCPHCCNRCIIGQIKDKGPCANARVLALMLALSVFYTGQQAVLGTSTQFFVPYRREPVWQYKQCEYM